MTYHAYYWKATASQKGDSMGLTQFPRFPDTGNTQLDEVLVPLYKALNDLGKVLREDVGLQPVLVTKYLQYKNHPELTFFPDRVMSGVYEAATALSYGDLVHIFLDSGNMKIKKAFGGAGGFPAHGYVKTTSTINVGYPVDVTLFQGVIAINGVTAGTLYYLSTALGLVSPTPPGSGVIQKVGVGIGPNLMYFSPELK